MLCKNSASKSIRLLLVGFVATLLQWTSPIAAFDCENCPPDLKPRWSPEFTFTSPELLALSSERGSAEFTAYLQRKVTEWDNQISTLTGTRVYEHPSRQEGIEYTISRRRPEDSGIEAFEEDVMFAVAIETPGYLPFVFGVTYDLGVFEIKARQSDLATLQKYLPAVEQVLFQSASRIGLRPHQYKGGGHISLDWDFFRRAPQGQTWAIRYLQTILQTPELASGMMGMDWLNAVPWYVENFSETWSWDHFLRDTDPGTRQFGSASVHLSALWKDVILDDFQAFIDFLNAEQRVDSRWFYGVLENILGDKTSSMRVHGSFETGSARLEHRFFGPQPSFNHFLLQLEMLENVLQQSKPQQAFPVPRFDRPTTAGLIGPTQATHTHLLRPMQSHEAQRYARAFLGLVQGLDAARFIELLPPAARLAVLQEVSMPEIVVVDSCLSLLEP